MFNWTAERKILELAIPDQADSLSLDSIRVFGVCGTYICGGLLSPSNQTDFIHLDGYFSFRYLPTFLT